MVLGIIGRRDRDDGWGRAVMSGDAVAAAGRNYAQVRANERKQFGAGGSNAALLL